MNKRERKMHYILITVICIGLGILYPALTAGAQDAYPGPDGGIEPYPVQFRVMGPTILDVTEFTAYNALPFVVLVVFVCIALVLWAYFVWSGKRKP